MTVVTVLRCLKWAAQTSRGSRTAESSDASRHEDLFCRRAAREFGDVDETNDRNVQKVNNNSA